MRREREEGGEVEGSVLILLSEIRISGEGFEGAFDDVSADVDLMVVREGGRKGGRGEIEGERGG